MVGAALTKMRRSRAAPPAAASSTKTKSETRVGYHWIEYTDGEKQREMFVGLQRRYEKESKRAAKRD